MDLQKGTLLRNKSDKKYAIVISEPKVKFFRDPNHRYGEFESGIADISVRIKWIASGYEYTFQASRMGNWEVISEGG